MVMVRQALSTSASAVMHSSDPLQTAQSMDQRSAIGFDVTKTDVNQMRKSVM